MIPYTLRIFAVGLRNRLGPRIPPFDPVLQRFRAWPWYCDQNLHINNAQYLTVMDFGRVAWLMRTGMWDALSARSAVAPAAGINITYRREIRWFSRFELETKVAGTDGRWLFLEQTFRQRGRVGARALVRVGFRSPNGLLAVADVLGAEQQPTPEVAAWIRSVDALVKQID